MNEELKTNYLMDKIDNLEIRKNEDNTNQKELFENKLRSILFPEPIFSQYINELKKKPSKPVKFPSADLILNDNQKGEQPINRKEQKKISTPQYTRYLRTWKRSVNQTNKLTNYLSNLRELHLAKLITFIEQMHKNSQYTDLDLYVDNLCFPVHKLILACYAPFIFQKLERNRSKQNPIEKLKLVHVDAESFAILIDFMYTGSAQPSDTNFLPVLNTAIHLFMFDFANAWVELYEHKFTSRTAQMLFRSNIAREYGWTDYIQMLNVALAFDFEHLLISDQYEDLQFEQLNDILQMDNISVVSEVVLYLAVLKWLNFNFEERKTHALNLMRLIRFTNMDGNELFACYNPPILSEVIEIPEIKAMMADAFNLSVQKQTKSVTTDDMNKQAKRNYRLANAYKDQQSLELWCYLSSKRRDAMICAKKEVATKLDKPKKLKERKDKTITTDTDSSQLDTSSKNTPSTASSFTNPNLNSPVATSSPIDLDLALSSDGKVDRLKPEMIRADIEKLISTDQQEQDTKLALLKKKVDEKQRVNDRICRCKEVKHTSYEECKRERAAKIIQRSFKRFHKLKTSKLYIPKVRPKLFGKKFLKDTNAKRLKESDEQSSLEEKIKDIELSKQKDNLEKKAKLGKQEEEEYNLKYKLKDKLNQIKSKTDLTTEKNGEAKILQSPTSSKSSSSKSTQQQFADTLTSVRSKEKNELNQLASDLNKETHRTEQLMLYSDSINQEFCGFFRCTGINNLDGQLIGWKKHFEFKKNKYQIPPYDTMIVNHGQCIYLVGGMQNKSTSSFKVSKQIFKYQPNKRKIQLIFNLKIARIQHSCVVTGDRLYVICGCKSLNVPVNNVECVHLMSGGKSFKLKSELIKLPTYGRFGQSSIYFRNRLWIIGGIAKIDNNFHLLSEIWILDVQNTNKWIKSKFPVPIAYAGICSVNEEFIYVVGGRCVGLNGKLQPSEKVWCFNVQTKRWQQIASLNQARCNCCCVLLDNNKLIYAFGGSLENDTEHLRGQTCEFYELNNPNEGWKMLNKNLPVSISGQSVVNVS